MLKIKSILFSLIISIGALAQTNTIDLEWKALTQDIFGTDTITLYNFDGATYEASFGGLPTYLFTQEGVSSIEYEVQLTNIKTEKLEVYPDAKDFSLLTTDFQTKAIVAGSRGEDILEVQVMPLRLVNGELEALTHFDLVLTPKQDVQLKAAKATSTFATNSVLASGNWVKISITETGMYKLTYSDILGMGIDPKNVRIFGNGGKMLDVYFTNRKYDDLTENAVWYVTGDDGEFNNGDYLLFYAQGPDTWDYNGSIYEHSQHKFDNTAYYFVTDAAGEGKSIEKQTAIDSDPDFTPSGFDDHRFIEEDEENLIESGSTWYSDMMYHNDTQSYTFNFPNIITTQNVSVQLAGVARSTSATSYLRAYLDNTLIASAGIAYTPLGTTGYYAKEGSSTGSFFPSSEDININLLYSSPSDASGTGWIDYFRIVARRALVMEGSEMYFRDSKTYASANVAQFNISNSNSNLVVLDITDVTNPIQMDLTISNGTASFLSATEASEMREFVAFYPSTSFPKPTVVGTVANQDLHGLGQTDYIIVTVNTFLEQAERLAEIHRAKGLSVVVTTLTKIYNEFSSGQRDITAIRWFAKSLYDKYSGDDQLKYLLLFGDGTYDNRITSTSNNPNFIPTYESENSIHQSESYVSDDYFGFMDDSEGSAGSSDKVDIGVGRFPVSTVKQATQAVDKIENYINNTNRTSWKNKVVFVADDQDGNIHVRDANLLADKVSYYYPDLVVDKIYMDAYQQVTTSSGPSFPDANTLVDKAINQGCAFLNYSGHGGHTNLAEEQIITLNGIKSYTNIDNLPVWVTATCEFGPYDETSSTSAGEWVFLSPKGGGIALFTTTRLVYSSANYIINNNFYNYAFEVNDDGSSQALGDIFRLTKKATGTGVNKRKFSLLGDPALRITYPTYKVITSEVNGVSINEEIDSIQALSEITISGYIENHNGEHMNTFNGTIYPTVYDKMLTKNTIGNDSDSSPFEFTLWETILFSGKSTVENGEWSFTFKVPKDINYNLGNGRIVYYATSEDSVEAHGSFEDIIVGGSTDDYEEDNEGPEIGLYLNSYDFSSGDRVNTTPLLIADLFDDNGINRTGSSIGHDIIVILDDDPTTTTILNDYYEAGDSQMEGTVQYKLSDLDEGTHTLKFRAWDIYNNSSTQTITFTVEEDIKPEISDLICYPNPIGEGDEEVSFQFSHDRPDEILDITIEIFSAQGAKIAILSEENISGNGGSINSLTWDLKTAAGVRVAKGLYLYRVTMTDSEQTSVGTTNKLLVR